MRLTRVHHRDQPELRRPVGVVPDGERVKDEMRSSSRTRNTGNGHSKRASPVDGLAKLVHKPLRSSDLLELGFRDDADGCASFGGGTELKGLGVGSKAAGS